MTQAAHSAPYPWARRTKFYQFRRDESGVVTVFAIMMMLMMLMVSGIGVDLMRNEMERTRLQNTLDRAVLAAADLDQSLDPAAVVADYFNKVGLASYLSGVTVSEGLNFRTVTATANSQSPTQFMSMVGVNSLPVPAQGAAEERISKVEISVVLDISGSMKYGSKMQNLRDAAKTFVDTVIRPETQDLVSLSLVPYSEHVNIGPDIYNQLTTNTYHNYSHCLEIPDSHFGDTALDQFYTYSQMQHFQWNTYSIQSGYQQNTRYDTVCPREDFERVTPISQNAQALRDQIDLLQPRAGTSIFLGMKWAVALLDPAFNSITNALVGNAVVDATFADRPVAYDDSETLKTVILMTDGQNSNSSRISSWAYNSSSEYVHWNNYNFQWYLNNYVSYYNRPYYYWQKYSAAHGDGLLDDICDAAKAQGIVIWAIGFETTDHGASTMENCASTPSHYFRVEGIELSEAFQAIARQINQLRLTQ
jgi:Flp pilus assembly protein TadG